MTIEKIVFELIPYLLQGLLITIEVTLIALILGLIIGVAFAIPRVFGGKISRSILIGFSTVMRALPHIVLLLILYFVISGAVNLSPFWAGSLSLAFISSAYQMEIFRGAIQSIEPGQLLAARSIGMTQGQAILTIILPQAFRLALPAWSNEAAITIKGSSLVYILGVPEMLRQAQYENARSHEPFIAYCTVAVLYFILTFLTNLGLGALERKFRIQEIN